MRLKLKSASKIRKVWGQWRLGGQMHKIYQALTVLKLTLLADIGLIQKHNTSNNGWGALDFCVELHSSSVICGSALQ